MCGCSSMKATQKLTSEVRAVFSAIELHTAPSQRNSRGLGSEDSMNFTSFLFLLFQLMSWESLWGLSTFCFFPFPQFRFILAGCEMITFSSEVWSWCPHSHSDVTYSRRISSYICYISYIDSITYSYNLNWWSIKAHNPHSSLHLQQNGTSNSTCT